MKTLVFVTLLAVVLGFSTFSHADQISPDPNTGTITVDTSDGFNSDSPFYNEMQKQLAISSFVVFL
jgi:hypothetical protein